jgi:sugar lactone lactonase YvrE
MTKVLGEATPVLTRRDTLGEGPAYDRVGGRLLWVDIHGHRVHELVADGDGAWRAGESWMMDAPVSAVVPHRDGGLVVAIGCEVRRLDADGTLTTIARIDTGGVSARLNDCKCDPRGRLLGGWLAYDLSEPGRLCRIDPDGTVTTLLEDVALSNGLGWSPDGATFYFTDTPTNGIDAFDYDLDAGTISNRRRLITIRRGEGSPDGMCVDDEGCIWTATLYSRQIRRYSPGGELVGVVDTPAHLVTSCAFGGPDGRELFITSIGEEIPRALPESLAIPDEVIDASNANPSNGLLLSCRPGVTGPPAIPFG